MEPLLDLGYVYELADNNPDYIYDIVGLYLDVMGNGLVSLEELIATRADLKAIHDQAHFLKSSAGFIKVRDIYENISAIDNIARNELGREPLDAHLAIVKNNFKEVLPILLEVREKNKPTEN